MASSDVIRYGFAVGSSNFKKRCFFGHNEMSPGKKEVRLQGVTSLIKKYFFHKKWSPMAISGYSSSSKQTGSERGKRVDKEITRWHVLKTDPKVRPSTLDRFRLKADRYTNLVIDALEAKGWSILSTQLPVGRVASRLGTAVDIKVRTRDGKVILIELKCGYNGVFTSMWPRSTEWAWCVAEGMTDIPANARTYSLIQLAWTWVLHNHSASVRADMAYVLNVNDSGASFHQLDLELLDVMLPRFKQVERQRVKQFACIEAVSKGLSTMSKKARQRKNKK